MRYRRANIEGGTYFFTVVTFKREKFLTQPDNVSLLREAFKVVMKKHPFIIDAFILLPDHLHCIWSLPENDNDFSNRWRLIKSYFSRNCNKKYKQKPSEVRKRKKEQAIWQRRFWEHLIRDDDDYKTHVEYIHYNPVKHHLAAAPIYWEYSSFHKYVQKGVYSKDWGVSEEIVFDQRIGGE